MPLLLLLLLLPMPRHRLTLYRIYDSNAANPSHDEAGEAGSKLLDWTNEIQRELRDLTDNAPHMPDRDDVRCTAYRHTFLQKQRTDVLLGKSHRQKCPTHGNTRTGSLFD